MNKYFMLVFLLIFSFLAAAPCFARENIIPVTVIVKKIDTVAPTAQIAREVGLKTMVIRTELSKEIAYGTVVNSSFLNERGGKGSVINGEQFRLTRTDNYEYDLWLLTSNLKFHLRMVAKPTLP